MNAPAPSLDQPLAAADRTARIGLAFGLLAYALWGVLPIYFKALAGVPAIDIVAHRIVWSLLVLAVLLGADPRLGPGRRPRCATGGRWAC